MKKLMKRIFHRRFVVVTKYGFLTVVDTKNKDVNNNYLNDFQPTWKSKRQLIKSLKRQGGE